MVNVLKSSTVTGNKIQFRNVVSADAHFIYSLRKDSNKSKHISKSPDDIQNQIDWINKYERSIDQAYFIIQELKSQRCIGTVRLYDPVYTPFSSFCWGSWILSSEAPATAAIESALMIYEYGFDYLGFSNSHFDVRKENVSVWKFHENTGAIRTSETDLDIFYSISATKQKEYCKKYNRFLPNKIKVIQDYVY